ncbi:DUF5753 domain-containing protein [Cryptosporangium sp. NPDC051539]|uniref:DUF5753 domain-containing protein n=1 Tax=Cryptosporangium sp. NPDC051539 TaxID=3363962 RepID=UPI00379A91A7
MTESTEPAVARRRLAQALRAARRAAPPPAGKKVLPQIQVAEAMGWHPSKLLRIEQAKTGISKNDLHMLLAYYGAEHRFVDLWNGVSTQRSTSRWRDERDLVSAEFIRFLEYEESAETIREYQPLLIPGLLQTEDYAQTVIEKFARPDDNRRRKERMLKLRLSRQRIWAEKRRCRLFVLLDHAAICRCVGGPAVMGAQLEKLQRLNEQDAVSIRVIPFDRDAHFGMSGPFIIVDFDGAAGRILYLDERERKISLDDPDTIDPYLRHISEMTEVAATVAETNALIDREIARMRRIDDTRLNS